MSEAIRILILAAATFACVTAGPDDDKWPDDRPEARPIQRISFPGHPWVGKAVFSKDGSRLFVHLPNTAINLWEVGVYYWPEALGGLLALTALVSIVALRRIAGNKRISGELHCRKCNYCLKDSPTDRCPECGKPIRRPIRGRPQWLRSLPWTCTLALIAVAYSALWAIQAPRSGRLSNYFNWWSPSLLKWANDKNVAWLVSQFQNIDEIVEYETASGSRQRTLITRASLGWAPWPFALSPDGEGIVIPIGDADAIGIVSINSGEVLHSVRFPDIECKGESAWKQIAGFNDAGDTVFMTALDKTFRKTKLVSWDWKNGAHEVLLVAPAYQTSRPGNIVAWNPRRFLPVPGSNGRRFLELPCFEEIHAIAPKRAEILIRDAINPADSPVLLAADIQGLHIPQYSPDGTRIFIPLRRQFGDLVAVDALSGKKSETIQFPAWSSFNQGLQVDRAHHRLIVCAYFFAPPSIDPRPVWMNGISSTVVFLAKDLDSGAWIGRFEAPNGWLPWNMDVSPNGRYFASAGSAPTTQNRIGEVLIYDLGSLPHNVEFETDEEWEARQKARQREVKDGQVQTTTTQESPPQRDVDR